jgi:hypothetical protein
MLTWRSHQAVVQADLEAAVTDAVVLLAEDGRRRKSWMVSGRGSFTTWSGWTVVARIVIWANCASLDEEGDLEV